MHINHYLEVVRHKLALMRPIDITTNRDKLEVLVVVKAWADALLGNLIDTLKAAQFTAPPIVISDNPAYLLGVAMTTLGIYRDDMHRMRHDGTLDPRVDAWVDDLPYVIQLFTSSPNIVNPIKLKQPTTDGSHSIEIKRSIYSRPNE